MQAHATLTFPDTDIASGDRFEIVLNRQRGGFLLPASVSGRWTADEAELEDAGGKAMAFQLESPEPFLKLRQIPEGWGKPVGRSGWRTGVIIVGA